ncbi:MAG TPA: hypothetical protein VEQ66_14940 [Propionibacteriaceae bacterium]|nr:hypothetical protein [Propionibacteriaceae bacterium]
MRRLFLLITAAVSMAALAVPGTLAAQAGPVQRGQHRTPYTFAVIGDIPYGEAEVAVFSRAVDQINADPDVARVDHLGDIKSGSTVCSDDYFARIRSNFDRFADPLVYTPGDNEWTDCHRPTNGAYNPLERLDQIRDTFFPRPGRTLGQRGERVSSQARMGVPENVRFSRGGVSFAAVHVVGSNNGLAPWTGQTAATPEQTAEVLGRTAAGIQLISDTFRYAKRHHQRGVVLLTQADMFDPTVTSPQFANYFAFQPIVAAIARESRNFDGQVYLFNGDSHVYNSDQPLSTASPWRSFYGIQQPADNLSRITVNGSDNADEYLKVIVHRRGPQVLTWDRVPLRTS